MPEYILDHSREGLKTFSQLDEFTQAYVEALFWLSECSGVTTSEFWSPQVQDDVREGRISGDIPGDVGVAELAPQTLAHIVADCAAFQDANAALLAQAYEMIADGVAYTPARAGHDFWLTRNGHGAGFWDRGLGEVGDKLSKTCRYGTQDVYFGEDNRVYIMGAE
jgi:hypothetical protein